MQYKLRDTLTLAGAGPAQAILRPSMAQGAPPSRLAPNWARALRKNIV